MAFIKSFFPRGTCTLEGIQDDQVNQDQKPNDHTPYITIGTKHVITYIQAESLSRVTKALHVIGIDFFTARDVRLISSKAKIKHGSQDQSRTSSVVWLEIMITTQSEKVQEVIDAILMSAREDFQSMIGRILVIAVEEMIQVNIDHENRDHFGM